MPYNFNGIPTMDDIDSIPSPAEVPGINNYLNNKPPEYLMGETDPWKLAQQAGGLVGDLAKGIYSSTVEPVGKYALGSAGTAIGSLKAMGAGINALGSGKDVFKEMEAARTSPVMWGEDNINWQAEKNPVAEQAGTSLEALGGLANIALMGKANLANMFRYNLGAGALMGAGEAIKKGKGPVEVIQDAALSGAVQGVLAAAIGKIFPGKKVDPANKFLRRGYSELEANQLAKIPKSQQNVIMEVIDMGRKRLTGETTENVTKQVSKEIDDFFLEAVKKKNELGIKLGTDKEDLINQTIKILDTTGGQTPGLVPMTAIATGKEGAEKIVLRTPLIEKIGGTLQNVFKALNIKTQMDDMGRISISSYGDVPKGSGEAKILNGILSQFDDYVAQANSAISKGKTFEVPLRDLQSITAQVDTLLGYLPAKSSSGVLIKKLSGDIQNIISEASPGFAKSNKAYAEFIKPFQDIMALMTEKQKSGKTILTGSKLLRRTQILQPEKYLDAIKSMQILADKFGLKVPTDLQLKGFLSNLIDKQIDATAPRALSKGIAQEAGREISRRADKTGLLSMAGSAVSKGWDYAFPPHTATDALNMLEKLITQGEQGILPKAQELAGVLSFLKPLVTGAVASVNKPGEVVPTQGTQQYNMSGIPAEASRGSAPEVQPQAQPQAPQQQFNPGDPSTWSQELKDKFNKEFRNRLSYSGKGDSQKTELFHYVGVTPEGELTIGGYQDSPIKFHWDDNLGVFIID